MAPRKDGKGQNPDENEKDRKGKKDIKEKAKTREDCERKPPRRNDKMLDKEIRHWIHNATSYAPCYIRHDIPTLEI